MNNNNQENRGKQQNPTTPTNKTNGVTEKNTTKNCTSEQTTPRKTK